MEWWLRGVEQLWGDMPHPREKEKPQQVGRRGKTTFGIKPHTCQRCPEGSNQPCAHQDPETPQRPRLRTVSGCLLRRCGSAVPSPRGRGSGCSRPGYGITLLEEVAINPTIEPPDRTQNWGNRHLEGTKRTLYTPVPRRKEQWPHKRLTQTCPWVSRSLQWRRGLAVTCFRVGGIECSSACMGPSEGGHHYIHYLHHSLAPGNNIKGTQPHPWTENWIKDLLSMPPPIRTRPSFPLSQSLPSGSFHKPLIFLHQKADRKKTTMTEN